MAKVWCAETECEYCKENKCTAKEINISAGHIRTVHRGFIHHWECRTFKMSEDAKEIFNMLKTYFDAYEERKENG